MAPDPKHLAAQAQDLKARGRLGEAIALYRQAVSAAPASAAAEHNLAAALGDAGRWAEAEAHINSAFTKGAAAAESWLVLARCLQSRSAFDEAEAAFLLALQRRSTLYEAHVDLAQLRWMRTGDASAAIAGVNRAIQDNPADLRLSLIKVKVLESTGRVDEACALTQALARAQPNDLAISVRASQLAALLGDSATALAHAERATTMAPLDNVAAVALITACLGAGDPARAEAHAAQLARRAPQDQHAIALLATAWRLLGDARYRTLYDYDALVKTTFLDVPAGWSSLHDYVEDLRRALRGAHALATHPFDQSIRHGSQVSDILGIDDPAIAVLPKALDRSISRYIADLGRGGDPLRQRNLGGHTFQGMWSIRMQAGGYHVDHVHPNGWISSACYIETPEAGASHDGWIKFGEPGVRTVPPLLAEHLVEPKPGMLVLFPSYMWHGVIPYSVPGTRLTFAFDLEPMQLDAGVAPGLG